MTAVVRTLHYPGDVTTDVVGQVVGPNTIGEFLEIVAAEYDVVSDVTTATLRFARAAS